MFNRTDQVSHRTKEDPDGINWDAFVQEGIRAREEGEHSPWALGDLANEVIGSYGDKKLQSFATAIRVNYNTLCRNRDVARAFPSTERFPNLTFGHHKVLVRHPERLQLAAKAEEYGWSVAKLILMARDPSLEPVNDGSKRILPASRIKELEASNLQLAQLLLQVRLLLGHRYESVYDLVQDLNAELAAGWDLADSIISANSHVV